MFRSMFNFFSTQNESRRPEPQREANNQHYVQLAISVYYENNFVRYIRDGSFDQAVQFVNLKGIRFLQVENDTTKFVWDSILQALQMSRNNTESLRIFKMLLERGANPRLKTSRDNNMLVNVINTNFFDNHYKSQIVESILEHAPDIKNNLDSKGKTPLYIAIQRNNSSITDVLKNHDAVVSEANLTEECTQLLLILMKYLDRRNDGHGVILEAIDQAVNVELFQYLFDKGADMYVTDEQRETLFEIATRNGREDILALVQVPLHR